ncbi:MAG: glycosyltransferase [Mobilitalea sp.]
MNFRKKINSVLNNTIKKIILNYFSLHIWAIIRGKKNRIKIKLINSITSQASVLALYNNNKLDGLYRYWKIRYFKKDKTVNLEEFNKNINFLVKISSNNCKAILFSLINIFIIGITRINIIDDVDIIQNSLLLKLFIKIVNIKERKINIFNNCNSLIESIAKKYVLILETSWFISNSTLNEICELIKNENNIKIYYFDHDHFSFLRGYCAPVIKPNFSNIDIKNTSIDLIGGLYLCLVEYIKYNYKILGDDKKNMFAQIKKEEIYHYPIIMSHYYAKPFKEILQYNNIKLIENTLIDKKVSIIIPNKDSYYYINKCINSIIENTKYINYEIIIVDNNSNDIIVKKYYEEIKYNKNVKILYYNNEFNFSAINNYAAKTSNSDILIFLNNDIEILDTLWLSSIVFYLSDLNVGCVGVKLLYPNNLIQHAGVTLGLGGGAGHYSINMNKDSPGYLGINNIVREVQAVTGACLGIRKEIFEAINGFSEELKVAFNDIDLCIRVKKIGLTNIQLNNIILIHHESKTRGYNNNLTKQVKETYERNIFIEKHKSIIKFDSTYSPLLSLFNAYYLSFPPRVESLIKIKNRKDIKKKNILILSCTYKIGYGVPVVIKTQAKYLYNSGFNIYIGGPKATNEIVYENCTRVFLNTAQQAADFAYSENINCIIIHTPPFYSITYYVPKSVKTLVYDSGEPPVGYFQDSLEREAVNVNKKAAFYLADKIISISSAVKAEMGLSYAKVIFLGNSHLVLDEEKYYKYRNEFRKKYLWSNNCIVILSVTRFHKQERLYKGINRYIELCKLFSDIKDSKKYVFILAGKADDDDVEFVSRQGIIAFPNVSDDVMEMLYASADIYISFSQWEGYNLGLAQAVANGIPSLALDIPVHHEFPATIVKDEYEACEIIKKMDRNKKNPFIIDWDMQNKILESEIVELLDS